METDKPIQHALQDCEEKVKELEEENQHLRDSSHAFGQLAERLNKTLQQERRTGTERRQSQRPNADRRTPRGITVRLVPDSSNDHD
jgi:predicted RNase H-like nuclease (RuvC/YqgF family)